MHVTATASEVPPACEHGRLVAMRQPRLKSTFARAVVPVAAGIAFFAVLGLLLWGVAALVANDDQQTDTFAPRYQQLGSTTSFARIVDEGGPIVFQDLLGDNRNVVLDHTGADPQFGWVLYLAHPADRDPTCAIEQVQGTREFIDCEGRTIDVGQLAPPPAGVRPEVSDDGLLALDLVADADIAASTTVETPGTTGG